MPLINNINLLKKTEFYGKTGQSDEECLKLINTSSWYKSNMSQTRFNRALVSLQLSVASLRWQCHNFNKFIIKYLLAYTKNYGRENVLSTKFWWHSITKKFSSFYWFKKHFVKWSGKVLDLNLNDSMKSSFIKFMKKIQRNQFSLASWNI